MVNVAKEMVFWDDTQPVDMPQCELMWYRVSGLGEFIESLKREHDIVACVFTGGDDTFGFMIKPKEAAHEPLSMDAGADATAETSGEGTK